jgi:hypothetical protein
MSLISLASYPNSRVKPRAATSETETLRISINDSAGANTKLLEDDADRTYIVLFNPSSEDIVYDYFDNPNILTEGFLLKATGSIDLETKGEVYAKSTTGSPVTLSLDIGRG